MSFESTSIEQRLLPATLEDRLVGWLGRASGFALLVAVGCVWASLLSWSIVDPSLTHATGGKTSNWLGQPGANISDLLVQTLGFASILLLLAPMLWALELLAVARVQGFRAKVTFFPLSVLMLAGAFSSLPVLAGWPLHHGYGGIIGDVLFNFVASILAVINPERESAAAGLLFFTLGGAALAYSVGVEINDILEALQRPATESAAAPEKSTGGIGRFWRRRTATATPVDSDAAPAAADPPRYEPMFTPEPQWPPASSGYAYQPYPAPYPQPVAYGQPAPMQSYPMQGPGWMPPAAMAVRMHQPAATADVVPSPMLPAEALKLGVPEPLFPPEPPSSLQGINESAGDESSRRMAERFAPVAGQAGQVRRLPSFLTAFGKGRTLLRTEPDPDHAAPVEPVVEAAPRAAPVPPTRRQPAALDRQGRPSVELLQRPAAASAGPEQSRTALNGNARLLEDVLADFGVKGEIRDIHPGPVVTLYELEPARGVKSQRVVSLADDIARSMSVAAVRVAVVPGRNVIGIELPNARREPVAFRDLVSSEAYRQAPAALPLVLGKSIGGEPVVADLARMPHLLVAGTTGSGKSVGINAMILSLLYRYTADECRFLMIDPKMLELGCYNGIPHLLTPVVTDSQQAVTALHWAVGEMEERYKRLAALGVRNIDGFNKRVREARQKGVPLTRKVQTGFDRKTGQAVYEVQKLAAEPIPYIVIVIDEFADLMIAAGKDVEGLVQRLAQMARAAGIHLVMATQRPSVDVVTGTIKANLPTRISFKVASKVDSRTILNEQGAEQLLGQGDMLYAEGGGTPVRVHGAFVSDEEVEAVTGALRSAGAPRYLDDVLANPAGGDRAEVGQPSAAAGSGSDEGLYERAVAIVTRDQKASTSYLQRRLSIGYNRAADLIERMEREGLVSPATATGKRDILKTPGAADAA